MYSFRMTCYEILTGGIPFDGVRASDYDMVLSGKRPELPSNLNPKMKDFMNRCWHQDPEARPTFNEIVGDLKKLHRELITSSESVSRVIDTTIDLSKISNSGFDIYGADPESCLRALRVLLEELMVKYNQPDFIVVGLEMVADMALCQSRFGLRSFHEQPVLPLPLWIMRQKLRDSIHWKKMVFVRIMAHIVKAVRIFQLWSKILATINEDYGLDGLADISNETFLRNPEV
jgi:serine/threonine protein kinase